MLSILLYIVILLLCNHKSLTATIRWKHNWDIHYVVKGNGPPLLLVPGFGVGTFHYEKNIDELSQEYSVYTLDLFGQGKSWPQTIDDIKPEQKLVFSTELWVEQLEYFIHKIIQKPVHIGGNSLGGYLSVILASKNPQLIKSISLLNPTPFWGFFDKKFSSIWNGELPAPQWALNLGSTYFNSLKSRAVVKTMLNGVYANNKAFDDKLVNDIIVSASHPVGPSAFTSILFARKEEKEFDDLLESIDIPIQLIMGKQDPWIVPFWGQRYKRIKPNMPYYEVSPSGHCPNDESPKVVNKILKLWIDTIEQGKELELDENFELTSFEDHGVQTSARILDGSPNPNNLFEIIGEWVHKIQLANK